MAKERKVVVPFEGKEEGEPLVSEAIFEELRKEEEGEELVRGWREVECEKWNTQGKFEGLRMDWY